MNLFPKLRSARHRLPFLLAGAGALAASLALTPLPQAGASSAPAPAHLTASGSDQGSNQQVLLHGPDGLGVGLGKVKHVWLIILENKSYDATFTGLNNNTYLWQTLPAQGVLLKNYYGTGHFSLDNYVSMVSGQAPITDDQSDCPFYDQITGSVDTSGSLSTNPNFGQLASAQGANAAVGSNGCVYPSTVPTLFNQLDSANVSWKGYAQDLGNPDASATGTIANPGTGPTHSAGVQACGAPFATPGATGTTTQANPGSANATDQYVPKHFPFPWFSSILASGDCGASHIASLFDPSNGLFHDLQSEATTPAFSWISPNNCSDAHDAVCHGNNLSGGFSDPNTPNAPANYTGGLYASDLFLQHVIPEIEASPAFKDGGLIDITFDEAFPAFTYTGNSFANSTTSQPNAAASIASDSAAETINGQTVHSEPTGPNTPLATDGSGNQLFPGPGDNAFVDRANTCVAQTVPAQPAGTCLLGGGSHSPGARTDSHASAPSGTSVISDNSAVATDQGRSVTGTGIPAGAFVGAVTNSPATATSPAQSGGFAVTGSFEIVDGTGNPLMTSAAVSGVTLGATTNATDPLFDATSPTTGGGDTGSVLISPFIQPGTVSNVFYNHYSWLRTMEDLFGVGSASPGLDGQGHIGYAAQPGLAPFGPDVFNNPGGQLGRGYWLVGSDGGIFSFGDAPYYGSTGGMTLNKPVVGNAATPDGGGYWLVASDGGIFSYGDAKYFGSTGAMTLNKPVVGMAPTPDGGGYWLVASDGGIFAYGDALYYGSTGAMTLNKPVVGMTPTPSGHGYWLVASDGGIFAYGDALFYGSTGGTTLNKPVVGMAATPTGHGYWLVGSDGGIFSYGDAGYYGSTGAMTLNKPVVGMAAS